MTSKTLPKRGIQEEVAPFEHQGDDKVRVHFYPPVAFLPRRVRLGVVRGQDHARRASQVPSTRSCHGRGNKAGQCQ